MEIFSQFFYGYLQETCRNSVQDTCGDGNKQRGKTAVEGEIVEGNP